MIRPDLTQPDHLSEPHKMLILGTSFQQTHIFHFLESKHVHFSALVSVLTALLACYCWLHWASDAEERKKGHVLPGPRPWPVLGSLHLMANFQKYPFEVFSKLQQVKIKKFRGEEEHKIIFLDLRHNLSNETWGFQLCRGQFGEGSQRGPYHQGRSF